MFVWALSFDQLKGGCGNTTTLSSINYLKQGWVWGNSRYKKLWNHLDNREKRDFGSTKNLSVRKEHLWSRKNGNLHYKSPRAIILLLLKASLKAEPFCNALHILFKGQTPQPKLVSTGLVRLQFAAFIIVCNTDWQRNLIKVGTCEEFFFCEQGFFELSRN